MREKGRERDVEKEEQRRKRARLRAAPADERDGRRLGQFQAPRGNLWPANWCTERGRPCAQCAAAPRLSLSPSASSIRAHKGCATHPHGASADEERWPVSLAAEKEGRAPVAGVKRSGPAGAATMAHQAHVQATAVNGASCEPLRHARSPTLCSGAQIEGDEKSASGQRRPDVSLALINSTYFVQRAARHRILISSAPPGKKSPSISETPREGGRVTCDPGFFVCAVLWCTRPKLLRWRSAHGRRGVPPAASAHKLPLFRALLAVCSQQGKVTSRAAVARSVPLPPVRLPWSPPPATHFPVPFFRIHRRFSLHYSFFV